MSTLRSLCLIGLVSAGGLACNGSPQEPAPATGSVPLPSQPGTPPRAPPDAPTPQPPISQEPAPVPEPIPQPAPPPAQEPPAPQYTREWFVSPSGSDTAPGTREKPLRTISKALTLVGPGEIVRVQQGSYTEKLLIDASVRAGTADAPITLRGEGKPKLLPTSSGWWMVRVQRPHWRIEGFELDVRGQRQVAVTFAGDTQGTVLSGNELHHGTFGSGISTDLGARGVTLEGNHIHHFAQGSTDSHGVVIAPSSRDITVRGNDIHDNSGDSVQCLGPEGFSSATPARGVLIEDNHLHDNRENAVDIKTCHDVTVRGNRMHGFAKSTTSRGEALVVHYSARNVVVEDNDVSDAGLGIAVGGNRVGPPPTNVSIRRNRIHGLRTPEGSAIRIENGVDVRVLHNTITGTQGFALVVGHGTGGDSSNVAVRNNVFATRAAVHLGTHAPGLVLQSNRYLPGAGFATGDFFVPAVSWVGGTLATWQGAGRDTDSQENASLLASTEGFLPGAGAVDQGMDLGLPFCGEAPDIGAVESGCPQPATATRTE